MDDTTILGAAIGQLGQTVKQAAKQVVKIPEEMAQDLSGQVGGSAPLRQGSEGQAKLGESKQENKQWQSDEDRVKFLRDLYGSSKQNPSSDVPDKSASFAKASAAKPEEQKKLLELRNQLHKEVYYDPTFNRKNPPAGGEERPAEKVENEKKEEMMDLQKKEEKKPQPLAVTREQNKAEMFRGAAG